MVKLAITLWVAKLVVEDIYSDTRRCVLLPGREWPLTTTTSRLLPVITQCPRFTDPDLVRSSGTRAPFCRAGGRCTYVFWILVFRLSFPPTRCKPVDGRGVEQKNVRPRSTIKNDGLVTNIMSFVKYLIPSNYLHSMNNTAYRNCAAAQGCPTCVTV